MHVARLGNCVVHGYSLNTSKPDLLHGGCRQHNSKLERWDSTPSCQCIPCMLAVPHDNKPGWLGPDCTQFVKSPWTLSMHQMSGCRRLQQVLITSSRPHTNPGLVGICSHNTHSLGKLK